MAEALFLTSQFSDLLEWLEFIEVEFPELSKLDHNVYNELLRGFHTVALLRIGHAPVSYPNSSLLFQLETHGWLLDYYQVHMRLVELHVAAVGGATASEVEQLRSQVVAFASHYRMPFFGRLAGAIV